MAKLSGTKLGKYQVGERLGRGGMAEVYKAFHPILERHVAIKVLHSFLSDGENFLARFQREAKAIAALDHPNIVQIYDIDTEDEHYYMVMELVEGSTLKNRLAQSSAPLPLWEIVLIFRKVALALDYAHQQGMLHRDIKPANILLGKDDRVALADFGIARILSDTQFTMTGVLIGTPAYMSPEQGKGKRASPTSDIYSLGILLYEMLTGKVPFDADTPLEVIRQHINSPLPSPRTVREDIPEALEKVIVKATEKNPSHRFQTASEMVEAIDRVFDAFPSESSISKSPTKDYLPEEAIAEIRETRSQKKTISMKKKDDVTKKTTVIAQQPANAVFLKKRALEKLASEKTQLAKATPNKRPPNPFLLILGIIGIAIIVGLLAWGLPRLSVVSIACTSIEECHGLAEERMGRADTEEALTAIENAINLVPENEHLPHAHLWCFRGEILVSLTRREEAIWSFENCIQWSEDDPDMRDLRSFAQEQIDMLNE
jgi:serine/threonine protein kinase